MRQMSVSPFPTNQSMGFLLASFHASAKMRFTRRRTCGFLAWNLLLQRSVPQAGRKRAIAGTVPTCTVACKMTLILQQMGTQRALSLLLNCRSAKLRSDWAHGLINLSRGANTPLGNKRPLSYKLICKIGRGAALDLKLSHVQYGKVIDSKLLVTK